MGELGGYGLALIDVRDLSEFLKERKCRAKKLLSYWDAHKQLFYDAIKGAKALPFYPLTVRSHEIFVCTDEEFAPPSGYEVVLCGIGCILPCKAAPRSSELRCFALQL